MIGRDIGWRTGGLVLYAGGCAGALLASKESAVLIVLFLVVLAGLVLMVNGKRVAVAIKAERRGHINTAKAVHSALLQRRKSSLKTDTSTEER